MKRLLLVTALLASGCDDYFPPTIESFTVDDANPPYATVVHLNFSVKDATVVSIIPDPGEVRGSPVAVLPRGRTTYTLRASNRIGSATKDVTVDPKPPPGPATILKFVVLPAQAPAGTQRTIAWTVQNSIGLTLHGGGLTPSLVNQSGQVTDSPNATVQYTLEASSAQGFQPAALIAHTVARVTPPGAITSFVATPDTISQGEASTLSWDGNALGWYVQAGDAAKIGTGPVKTLVVRPSATTTYTLTGDGAGGPVGPQTATVTVIPRPATTLAYTPPAGSGTLVLLADACPAPCTSLTLRLKAGASGANLRGVAIDLPADSTKISVTSFTPAAPLVGKAVLGSGPLKDTLVLGAAAPGTGSGPAADVPFSSDAEVANFVLALAPQGGQGPVFDGSGSFKAFIQSASARTPGGIAVGRLEAR